MLILACPVWVREKSLDIFSDLSSQRFPLCEGMTEGGEGVEDAGASVSRRGGGCRGRGGDQNFD